MRRSKRKDVRALVCVGVCVAVACLMGLSTAWAQPDEDERNVRKERLGIVKDEGIHGGGNDGPAEGTLAPDFALTPLKFYEFKIDEKDITVDNAGDLYKPVKLSDFKGKKPVVLIFGSYT